MTGRNYINPNDRGRFGFSESGEFKAPYKGAPIFAVLIICAGILIDVLALVALIKLGDSLQVTEGEMFVTLAQGVVMLIVVILTIIFISIAVRAVTSGFKCRYTANDEKFILTYGGDVHTFYYKDVQTVHFIPRSSLGKVSGYDVTIRIKGEDRYFSIVSDSYISEKSTPFNIIRERAEIVRNAQNNERIMLEGRNSVGDSNKPIFAEDIAKAQAGKKDVFDRMAELLGKDAEMPGVSLGNDDKNSARAVRAYKAEQEARAKNAPVIPEGIEGGYDVSKVMEKVSPTAGGYAADMPTIGKDGRVVSVNDTYIAEDGKRFSLDDVQGYGTFHVAAPKKTAVVLGIFAGIFLAWTCLTAVFIVQTLLINPSADVVTAIIGGAAALLTLTAALIIIRYIRHGKKISYKANGREFVVSEKKKPDEHIYYNDVAGVTYSKLKFLWIDNGYKVEITTKYGVIKYNFVYPKFRRDMKTEDLPFELIRKNVERLKNK
ncbi:MAG: hypothetical protein K2N38_06420 [Oscillospiraceae bacterium]|nr:hypothetical protein [Oscillospiraceae bacterium]